MKNWENNRRASDEIAHVIATMRIIIEHSMEGQSSLYINFIDFEKALVDRRVLWMILRHYVIPVKIIKIIQSFYQIWHAILFMVQRWLNGSQ